MADIMGAGVGPAFAVSLSPASCARRPTAAAVLDVGMKVRGTDRPPTAAGASKNIASVRPAWSVCHQCGLGFFIGYSYRNGDGARHRGQRQLSDGPVTKCATRDTVTATIKPHKYLVLGIGE